MQVLTTASETRDSEDVGHFWRLRLMLDLLLFRCVDVLADAYGFRQAIVATTAAGSVYGLHSSDGHVLWSKRIPSPMGNGVPPALPYLFLCRGTGISHAVVVAQSESAWAVHELHPFSGKLLSVSDGASGEGTVLHATRLTQLAPADGSSRPPVMLVDDALGVHLHPHTAETTAALKSRLGDVFFYLHNAESGSLTGYEVGFDGDRFVALPRWSMALPGARGGGRPAVSLSSFPADAAVHSPVRVLGDRTVLHKYINRNLLAVGVEHAGEGGDFDEPSLQVMLVDAVSGRVVHSASHPGASGPLTMAMGDNWVVYHYWSPKALVHHMAVAELFVNTSIADDPLKLALGGAPDYTLRENGFDAFHHELPHVLSQGYAFASAVKAMAVTQTIAGLTPKFVLVATAAGQLYLLDRKFLDPRRPLVANPQKMSTADREEGLVPYGPSLGGIVTLAVATHRHTLARPRHITASATYLESTSLAFVVGLDLFMSRVAPAREFDRLNEDFNFVALVLSIIGLTVHFAAEALRILRL